MFMATPAKLNTPVMGWLAPMTMSPLACACDEPIANGPSVAAAPKDPGRACDG